MCTQEERDLPAARQRRPAPQAARAASGASGPSGFRVAQGRAAPPPPLRIAFGPMEDGFPHVRLDLRAKGQSVGLRTSVNNQVFTDAKENAKSRRAGARQERAG